MVEILTELMKIEGHVNVKYLQVSRYRGIMKVSADSLFEAKGISSKQFEKSYEFYAHQQQDLKRMYEKVLDNLNHELTDLELKEQNKK